MPNMFTKTNENSTPKFIDANRFAVMQGLSFLIGILVSAIIAFITWLISGLISAYIFDKILFMFSTFSRNEKFDSVLEDFKTTVVGEIRENRVLNDHFHRDLNRSFDCRYLGGKDDGLAYLMMSVGKAKKCYNTFVAYGVRDDEHDPLLFADQALEDMAECYLEMLKRPNTLVANLIYGPTTKFAKIINKKVKASKGDVIKGTHLTKVLKDEIPILNFTIIEYSDKKEDREVIFGWGHHKDDWTGSTFISGDPHLVSTFMSYYKCLSSKDLCDLSGDLDKFEN